MRGSRMIASRKLLAVIALVVGESAGCRSNTGVVPEVIPTVTEVRARRLRCQNQNHADGFGQLVGCRRQARDTAYFLTRARAGQIVSFGREVLVPISQSRTLFDSLSSARTRESNVIPLQCSGLSSQFWKVRESRWGLGEWQYILRESVPADGTSPTAILTMGAHLGQADCSTRFGTPFLEGPPG